MLVTESSGKKQQNNKPASEAKARATAEPEISIARLDIRVGLITSAQKHPDADSLYVEEIDVGEGQTRTVVSGLVKYIPVEEMQVFVHSSYRSQSGMRVFLFLVDILSSSVVMFNIYDSLAESEGVCSLQPEASYHAGYKITSNGSCCIQQ